MKIEKWNSKIIIFFSITTVTNLGKQKEQKYSFMHLHCAGNRERF